MSIFVGLLYFLETPDLVPSIASVDAWVAVLCAGAVATISCLLVAEAYRTADATVLAPIQYLEIVMATVLGFLVFGEFPDMLTWLGVMIILGSGAYIFHRERHSVNSAPRRRRGGR